jgi:hypothetical protein
MLSSSIMHKNKEELTRNGGGELGKKCVSVFVLVAVKSLLNMTPPFITVSGLGNPFVSRFTIHKFICWVLLDSMLPRQQLCHPYVQEKTSHIIIGKV